MTGALEYSRRLQAQVALAAALGKRDTGFGIAKLLAALIGLAVAWLTLISHLGSPWWTLLPIGAFVALSGRHDGVIRARARAERAAAFYKRGVARVEDAWAGTGTSGDRFRDPKHVYSDDLDLFGRGSLFELLCDARTPMGENRLADWLRRGSSLPEILARQQRIEFLRAQLDMREELAVIGEELKARLDPQRLTEWAATPPSFSRFGLRWGFAGCVAALLASAAWWGARGQWMPLAMVVLVESLITFRCRPRALEVVGGLGNNGRGLVLFARVLRRAGDPEGAGALRRLARYSDWIEASGSLIVRLLEIPLLYNVQLAFAAESWRRQWGPRVAAWIDAVGEFEAQLSLAGYAFDHPDDPWPVFVEGPDPVYHAEALGHPLLPAAGCVRNSIALDGETRILLVSGSNMSGKSTLLRSVGVNLVLAQMGAPVRARRLELTRMELGTRLRTGDSLQEGRSGFYSEILRIRQVYELANGPLLFLFDELLEGTNSKDRVLGAAGLLRALLERRAIGLVTTHDLALTEIAAGLGERLSNVHFEDQIEGDNVSFDHRLRPGVVTKSNALALMRLIGLGFESESR